MKATYCQRGEALDYKNTTNETIPANTVIAIASRIGVTGGTIDPGQTGTLHVCGIFEIKKAEKAEIALGDLLYYSEAGITTKTDNGLSGEEKMAYVPAGYAVQMSAAANETVTVKLLG